MALPHARDARPYYYAAGQRLEDAEFLLAARRTTGAIYLGGYAVECMLKALILAALSPRKRNEMLATFRGAKGHDFGWLRAQYSDARGAQPPGGVLKAFAYVSTWEVEVRYKAGVSSENEASSFLKNVRAIVRWADERI